MKLLCLNLWLARVCTDNDDDDDDDDDDDASADSDAVEGPKYTKV